MYPAPLRGQETPASQPADDPNVRLRIGWRRPLALALRWGSGRLIQGLESRMQDPLQRCAGGSRCIDMEHKDALLTQSGAWRAIAYQQDQVERRSGLSYVDPRRGDGDRR